MQFTNISAMGDLDVIGVGIVLAGETFEADGELAERLLDQPDLYEPDPTDPAVIAHREAEAAAVVNLTKTEEVG